MAPGNVSFVTKFILLGSTDWHDLQLPLFFLFWEMHMVIGLGNLGLIMINTLNSHLHTPMYFFLLNFSFIDLFYSSVYTPNMLINFISKKNVISYMGCKTQLYFFSFLIITECYLLTSMAYDCHVAICKPLLYNVVMSPKVCSILMLVSYLMAFSGVMVHTGCMLRLTFCDTNNINHYFCDIFPLLKLSCTGSHINELVAFIVVGINISVPSHTILVSYDLILTNISHISSIEGRSKTFSTCYPHIIAVSLFFGSCTFIYLKPSPTGPTDERSLFCLLYQCVPMMNPLSTAGEIKRWKLLWENPWVGENFELIEYLSVQLVIGKKVSVFNHYNFAENPFVSFQPGRRKSESSLNLFPLCVEPDFSLT